jgi:hypothetical protein
LDEKKYMMEKVEKEKRKKKLMMEKYLIFSEKKEYELLKNLSDSLIKMENINK